MSSIPPPPPPPPPPPGASPVPGGADAGAALSYGFKKFQASAGVLIIAMIIPAIAGFAVSIVGGIVFPDGFGAFAVQVVAWVASTMGAIGVWRVALMIAAGETPDLGRAYQYDRWGEWLAFSVVYGLIIYIGLLLCVIPGLVAMAFLGLAPLFFIDGRRAVGDALTASREAASSQKLALPVFLVTLVGPLGLLLCFVGVFLTVPVSYVGLAYLYRNATGQPVAP